MQDESVDEVTGEIVESDDGSHQYESREISNIVRSIGSPRQIDIGAINLIVSLAPAWRESNWFGIRTPEQAIVLMAKAYELGFPLTSAFDFFDIIPANQGVRVTLKPKGALALIYRSGLLKGMIIEDKKDSCYVRMQRKDNDYAFGLIFTMDMARQAGLVKEKGAWEKYPSNMLRWRAVSFVSQIVFPDVLAGLQLNESEGVDYDQDR